MVRCPARCSLADPACILLSAQTCSAPRSLPSYQAYVPAVCGSLAMHPAVRAREPLMFTGGSARLSHGMQAPRCMPLRQRMTT